MLKKRGLPVACIAKENSQSYFAGFDLLPKCRVESGFDIRCRGEFGVESARFVVAVS
jgi:hypothetical protein